jgi:hypothetical protein
MIEGTIATVLFLQFCWMLSYNIAQRRENQELRRRLNALGTELGVVKARSLRSVLPELPMATPIAIPAGLLPDDFRMQLVIGNVPRRRRPSVEQFEPSWI